MRDLEDLRRARLDVREDEAPRDLAPLGGGDRVHVPAELELEALETGRAREAREVLGEVERLHLVDDDAAAVLPAAVEAALEDGREVVDGEREADALLGRVAGNRLEVLAEDAAVDGLSDPQALEAVAAVEADAAGSSRRGGRPGRAAIVFFARSIVSATRGL